MIESDNVSPAAPDPALIESPSHIFSAAEQQLDLDLVRVLNLPDTESAGSDNRRRARLSEGEALGGLALLHMFGTERLIRARINLARERRTRAIRRTDV